MSFKADVLVIMPHPDDAEFGAGGTIAKMTAEGKKVAYVVCTNGDKGTSDRNMIPSELVKIREEEQRQAAGVLGVSRVVFLGKPDQGLENTPECVRSWYVRYALSNHLPLLLQTRTNGISGGIETTASAEKLLWMLFSRIRVIIWLIRTLYPKGLNLIKLPSFCFRTRKSRIIR